MSRRDPAPGMKWCYHCKTDRPRSGFHKLAASRDGLQNICKACTKIRARRWREENPEKHQAFLAKHRGRFRGLHLKRYYGITTEQYDAMFQRQGGKCAICRQPERRHINGKAAPLAVDHHHATGAIRALLCHACNTSLAPLERPKWLADALVYLLAHGTPVELGPKRLKRAQVCA